MSEQVLYSQASPGWCSSGMRDSVAIQASGAATSCGCGGPCFSSLNSGPIAGSEKSDGKPYPARKSSRSTTVMGLAAGTTSSIGLVGVRTTVGAASSGSHCSTGSFSAILPSSTSIMTAAAVMGLVIDAMRKSESRAIGDVPLMSTEPTACTSTRSPRATRATAPGTGPLLTCASRMSCRLVNGSPSRACGRTGELSAFSPRVLASGPRKRASAGRTCGSTRVGSQCSGSCDTTRRDASGESVREPSTTQHRRRQFLARVMGACTGWHADNDQLNNHAQSIASDPDSDPEWDGSDRPKAEHLGFRTCEGPCSTCLTMRRRTWRASGPTGCHWLLGSGQDRGYGSGNGLATTGGARLHRRPRTRRVLPPASEVSLPPGRRAPRGG